MTVSNDYILLPFFNRLRKSAGMELDMTQYFLFLELFMQGYGKDKPALKTLCKTLWLTQAKFRDSFEQWFDEAYKEMEMQWLPATIGATEKEVTKEEPKLPSDTIGSDQKEEKKQEDNLLKPDVPPAETPQISDKPDQDGPDDQMENRQVTSDLTEIMLNFDERGGKAGLSGKKQGGKLSEKDTAFIFSDEKHLPIPPRRWGHALQKLRMTHRFRTGHQLDIAAMVGQLGRERFLTQIDYERVGASSQNVLLLTDHEGSMSAFEAWGDFLYDSLAEHPGIEQIKRYYFHDHPVAAKDRYGADSFKLFNNPSHTASTMAGQLFSKANEKSTWLIIFGDAGVYEAGLDAESLQHWWQFLEIARRHVAAITWFNPLHMRRWEGTLAGYLSFLVKMLPFDPDGAKKSIKLANNANRNRTS